MPVKSMSLLTGTALSATGGTAFVFADDGVTVQNGVHITVPATADYRVRESATLKFRPPTLDALGVYSRDKKSVSFTVPIILASGKIVNNVIRIEREVHPEWAAASAVEMNKKASQLLFDADMDNFWSAGSVN